MPHVKLNKRANNDGVFPGIIKLGHPFERDPTVQRYGSFEGFPLNSALCGLINNDPVFGCCDMWDSNSQ